MPLSEVDPLRIALAWRERDTSPLVAAFAAGVREIAADPAENFARGSDRATTNTAAQAPRTRVTPSH